MKVKKFDNFIDVLYHSTDKDSLFSILSQNKIGGITPQEIDGVMYRGISTTDNKDFIYRRNPFTIILDRNKVAKKYKLKDVDFFNTNFGAQKAKDHNINRNFEHEVFIITSSFNKMSSLNPVSDYMIGLRINGNIELDEDLKEIIRTDFTNIKIYNNKGIDITNKVMKPYKPFKIKYF